MTRKVTDVRRGDALLWTALLIFAVLCVQFDVQLEAFVRRHLSWLFALIVAACVVALGAVLSIGRRNDQTTR